MKLPLRPIQFLSGAAILISAVASKAARPGDLDLHLNPAGTGGPPGTQFFSPENVYSLIKKLALLPDGKIIGMGLSAEKMVLIRWFPDGRLDTSFGTGGFALPAQQSFSMDALAVQPDGKILVSGQWGTARVLRFLPDGTPDPSFGEGGRVILPDTQANAASLAVLNDGKIVAAGSMFDGDSLQPRLWRMLPDGSLDHTFGSAGEVTLPFPGSLFSIVAQPDGKLVAAGHDAVNGIWLGRLGTGGTPDPAFSEDGSFIVEASLRGRYTSVRLILQNDGKILLSGDCAQGPPNGYDEAFFVNRYLADGSPDLTFNGSGSIVTNPTPGTEFAGAFSMQSDGKLLLAGKSGDSAFILARYLTNGTIDSGFGEGGIAKFPTPVAPGDAILGMVVLTDGKILMGGGSTPAQSSMPQTLLMRWVGKSLPEYLTGEWPAGTILKQGQTVRLGPAVLGNPPPEMTLTLRNTGPAPLTNLAAALSGPGASRFTLVSPPPAVLHSGESATLRVNFPPAQEISGATAALTIETGDPEIEDFLIILRGESEPPVSGMAVLDGTSPLAPDATVDFGVTLPEQPLTRTFTLKNTGNINLLLQGITLGAAGTPGDFTVLPPETASLEGGATSTFSITFTPGGPGPRTARLRIASTDTLNPPFEMNLAGTLAGDYDIWRLTHFGAFFNEGSAADFSDPDHDGIVNLMEYATLNDPLAPSSAGQLTLKNNVLEYTFIRPSAAVEMLSYSAESSTGAEGPWIRFSTAPVVLSDDGTRQQVKFQVYSGLTPSRFLRLRVSKK